MLGPLVKSISRRAYVPWYYNDGLNEGIPLQSSIMRMWSFCLPPTHYAALYQDKIWLSWPSWTTEYSVIFSVWSLWTIHSSNRLMINKIVRAESINQSINQDKGGSHFRLPRTVNSFSQVNHEKSVAWGDQYLSHLFRRSMQQAPWMKKAGVGCGVVSNVATETFGHVVIWWKYMKVIMFIYAIYIHIHLDDTIYT